MKIKANAQPITAKASPYEWFLLFKEGEVTFDDLAPVQIDEEAFSLINAEFERRGNDMVVDYEHQTLEGDQAPAAGWIKELRYDKGQGIMARAEWTQKALEYFNKREYRYFSPVFYVNEDDKRVYKLESVALTNLPRTNNLTPIVAKTPIEEQNNNMNFLQKLIKLLGLSAEATEEDVLSAVTGQAGGGETPTAASEGAAATETADAAAAIDNAETQVDAAMQALAGVADNLEGLKDEILDTPVAAKALLNALGLKQGATYRSVVASVHALKQQAKNDDLAKRLQALEAAQTTSTAAQYVAKGLSAGKITADQKSWAMGYATADPKGFNEFLDKAPVVVPVDKLPAYVAKAANTAANDDFDESIGALFGVTKDDYNKFGRK